MSRRWECSTHTSCHVTSRHIMSCHVTSCHVISCHVLSRHIATSKRRDSFWVLMNNITILGTKHRNVARFSNDGKVEKIQYLGLLLTSKLFLLHIHHPRSSHDHTHKEQHWIYTFSYQKSNFQNFSKHRYQKPKTLNNKLILMHRGCSNTTECFLWMETLVDSNRKKKKKSQLNPI